MEAKGKNIYINIYRVCFFQLTGPGKKNKWANASVKKKKVTQIQKEYYKSFSFNF